MLGCDAAEEPWLRLRILAALGRWKHVPRVGARRSCPFPGEQESGKAQTLSPVPSVARGPWEEATSHHAGIPVITRHPCHIAK